MTRLLLPGTDLTVSSICYGTADFGSGTSDADVAALLNAYRDAGGTFVDTAHVYAAWTTAGAGSSERAIARYLKANPTKELVIATKGGHPTFPSYRTVERWLDPCRVRADVEDSLGRLDRECIDLYYLHRDDLHFTVGEIVEMANEFVAGGLVRNLGASNWTRERLRAANEYAAAHGLRPFVVAQDQFSLAQRDPVPPEPYGSQGLYVQPEDMRFHAQTGLPLCAYSATGRGAFSGGTVPEAMDSAETRARRARAGELARRTGHTPTQIALGWLMHLPFPCIPITGTTSLHHLRENLGAADVTLTDDETTWLQDG